jgi:hypothetical protein
MTSDKPMPVANQAASGCSALIGVVFFAVFLCAGIFFEYLIARDFARTVQTYGWGVTECQIETSRVIDTDEQGRPASDYRFEVQYIYTVGGKTHTSRQFMLRAKSFSDYSEAQRLAIRYASGAKAVCYVNPSAPEEAVLRRGSLWSGLTLLFPLIFVGIGGGGIFFSLRSIRRGRQWAATGASAQEKPLSEKVPGTGRWVLAGFFGIFLAVGLAAFYGMTLRPLARIIEARGWRKTACTVISSEVKGHSSDDGTTYSVNILYAYEVGDREYRSNRYHFMGGSSSGYEGKARVVRRYPPGRVTFCFVNPRDPTEAVLERGLTTDLGWGLLPLIFVAVGGGGIYFAVWRMRPGAGTAVRASRGTPPGPLFRQDKLRGPALSGENVALPRTLKPGTSPLAKLIGAIFVALFWNGIVSVFVWQAIRSWVRHRPEWFLTLFILPFVAVGLVMIGFVVRTFLALFNPKPRLTVTPGAVALGTAFEVTWELSGRTGAISRLRICLEGREEVQYQSGDNTSTDKSVFARFEVANTTDRLALQAGQARLTLPAGLMHSWAADHNKIIWSFRVSGQIPRWPDVDEEFPLTVLPQTVRTEPHEQATNRNP